MKILVILLFVSTTQAMHLPQQQREPRSHSAPPALHITRINIYQPQHEIHLREHAQRVSEAQQNRRYRRKVKIALIGLAGSCAGAVTALIVYLTK